MIEWLLAWTALPNLHPALVHFPIALAAAALLFDAAALAGRLRGADRAGAALWVLAAAGAGAATLAGEEAAEGLARLAPEVERAVDAHEEAAELALVAVGTVAALRLAMVLAGGAVNRGAVRWAALVAALAVQALMVRAADLGGALVYRHGVEVAAVSEGRAAPRAPVAAERGLELPVDGRVELALGAPPGDARVTARLEASGFRGAVVLVRRSADGASSVALRVAGDGRVRLTRTHAGTSEALAEGRWQPGPGPLELTLSGAGTHWRGYVRGRSVVHGHGELTDAGPSALVLEGRGAVRVLALRVIPMGGEAP